MRPWPGWLKILRYGIPWWMDRVILAVLRRPAGGNALHEARLFPFAVEMLTQIEKSTVDFVSILTIPKRAEVLPAAIPI
jgi:hypothetical protein